MLLVEKFCSERGFTMSYLTTTDQQIFYSKLGYAFCEPVMAYSGNMRLPRAMVQQDESQIKKCPVYKNAEELARIRLGSAVRKRGGRSPTISESSKKNSNSEEDRFTDDIAVECSKVFTRPEMPSEPPLLPEPPRLLQPTSPNSKKKKIEKSEIHRINMRHDFMRKKI